MQGYTAYSENGAWFCGPNLGQCKAGERGNLSDTIQSEKATTASLGFKTEFVPVTGVSVIAELPFHRLRYRKDFGDGQVLLLQTDGVGDLRLAARAGLTAGSWGFAAGYALELPTGEFAVSAALAPVGSGTRNHDLFVEFGRSLWPAPLFAEAGVLVRLREAHTDEDAVMTDWGDELHARLHGGWNFSGPWTLQSSIHAFRSGARSTNVPGEPRDQFRSLLELVPGALLEAGAVRIEGWLNIPLAGRNTPSDPRVGISVTWFANGP